MKAFFKLALCLVVSTFFASTAFAQIDFNHPKFASYGDSAESREANYTNYSFFRDDVTLKNFTGAAKRLEELVAAAPACTENIYIMGVSVYKNLINSATTDAQKQDYINKTLKLYDLREQYFGGVKSRIILANKSLDMMRYRSKDLPAIRKTVALAISKSSDNVNLEMALQYFNLLVNNYTTTKNVDTADLLDDFDMVNTAVTNSKDSANKANVLRNLDELLLQSGAANCENLESIFKPKYTANPNDAELIKKIMGYLMRNECKSAFVTELSEKYYSINPSPESAFSLAVLFASADNDAKAQKYFKEAVELDTKHEQINKYLMRYAGHELVNGRSMSAARLSKQAISYDPNQYASYMLLAQSYAMGANSTGCDGFNKKTIFFLVVDNLQKAKSLTNDSSDVQKINDMIRTYAAYFPTKEDIFFQEGIRIGGGINVNCGWISGSSSVRTSN
ncbi:MAG: hypothetical protein RSF94_02190 [Rikenellaceae bacterium]